MGLIRLALALSVVVFHFAQGPIKLLHAGTAVLLFFVMSGFYMALVLNEKYADDTRAFYKARLLRIFPVYWVCVLLSMATEDTTQTRIQEIANLPWPGAIWSTVMNVGIFGRALHQAAVFYRPTQPELATWLDHTFGAGMFVDSPTQIGSVLFVEQPYWVGQAWTLELELCFYLIAPFIVKSWRRLVICFLASLVLRLGLSIWPGHPIGIEIASVGYHLFPTTLCLFLLGSAAYYAYRSIKRWPMARIGVVLAPAAIALCAVSAPFSPLGYALSPFGRFYYDDPRMWLAYLSFAAMLPFVFRATKSSRVDRLIGELSYPVYLIQAVSMWCSRMIFGEDGINGEFGAVVVTCASAAALLVSVNLLGLCMNSNPANLVKARLAMVWRRSFARL
jgi:peptidoglycan/LPS O-acetylase OafA/YrhL